MTRQLDLIKYDPAYSAEVTGWWKAESAAKKARKRRQTQQQNRDEHLARAHVIALLRMEADARDTTAVETRAA